MLPLVGTFSALPRLGRQRPLKPSRSNCDLRRQSPPPSSIWRGMTGHCCVQKATRRSNIAFWCCSSDVPPENLESWPGSHDCRPRCEPACDRGDAAQTDSAHCGSFAPVEDALRLHNEVRQGLPSVNLQQRGARDQTLLAVVASRAPTLGETYMRCGTPTIDYPRELPLAQRVRLDVSSGGSSPPFHVLMERAAEKGAQRSGSARCVDRLQESFHCIACDLRTPP